MKIISVYKTGYSDKHRGELRRLSVHWPQNIARETRGSIYSAYFTYSSQEAGKISRRNTKAEDLHVENEVVRVR